MLELSDILMSELGFASFLKFVNSEFATENLLFWLSVQRFKDEFERLTVPARQQHMNAIFSKYVATGAEFENQPVGQFA